MLVNILKTNWSNESSDIDNELTNLLKLLSESKLNLSVEIYPAEGQDPIVTKNTTGDVLKWNDIFDRTPNIANLGIHVIGFTSMSGQIILKKVDILRNFVMNLDSLHHMGIVIKDLKYDSIMIEGDGNVVFVNLQNSILSNEMNWSRNIQHSPNPEKTHMLEWVKFYKNPENKIPIRNMEMMQIPMPPRAMPPGAMPPRAMPPGAMPPGAMPPRAMPPGAMPPGAMPPGAMPPGNNIGMEPYTMTEPEIKARLGEIHLILKDNDIYGDDGEIKVGKLAKVLSKLPNRIINKIPKEEADKFLQRAVKYKSILNLDPSCCIGKGPKEEEYRRALSIVHQGMIDCGGNPNKEINKKECDEFIDDLEQKGIRSASMAKTKKKKKKKKKRKTGKKSKKVKKTTKKRSQNGG